MAKFKIGEEVAINKGKAMQMTLHITEIREITCSAGTQVFYLGRIWADRANGRECSSRAEFSEIELEAKL